MTTALRAEATHDPGRIQGEDFRVVKQGLFAESGCGAPPPRKPDLAAAAIE